jgi:nitroreductase
LDAANWAPSGGNIRPWEFIVLDDPRIREMIRKISPGYFGEAPLAVLVCSNREKAFRVGGALGRDYLSISDCAMATQNMLLAAYSQGLGTCVVKSFSHTAIKEILEIPKGIEPELLVIIGYPDHTPKPPHRTPLDQIAYLNKYGERSPNVED